MFVWFWETGPFVLAPSQHQKTSLNGNPLGFSTIISCVFLESRTMLSWPRWRLVALQRWYLTSSLKHDIPVEPPAPQLLRLAKQLWNHNFSVKFYWFYWSEILVHETALNRLQYISVLKLVAEGEKRFDWLRINVLRILLCWNPSDQVSQWVSSFFQLPRWHCLALRNTGLLLPAWCLR